MALPELPPHLRGLAPPGSGAPRADPAIEHVAAIAAATAAVARLDERLASSPPAVREGWLARALIHEAAASSRLSGDYADAAELRLFEIDAFDGPRSPELGHALNVLVMLRSAARRSSRQMFTPLRLVAVARLRLRDNSTRRSGMPEWLRDRLADAWEIRDALSEAVAPDAMALWKRQAPLLAAAGLIARWHTTRCADIVGPAPGRALATAWLTRAGLTRGPWFTPSVGFLGHMGDYRPARDTAWERRFIAAAQRAAEWGLGLHRRLAAAHAELHAAAQGRRSTSRLPALIDLLVARSALTAAMAAKELGVSQRAASDLLEVLRNAPPGAPGRRLVRELAGREAFRVYGVE